VVFISSRLRRTGGLDAYTHTSELAPKVLHEMFVFTSVFSLDVFWDDSPRDRVTGRAKLLTFPASLRNYLL
jgi:hypothetical protein